MNNKAQVAEGLTLFFSILAIASILLIFFIIAGFTGGNAVVKPDSFTTDSNFLTYLRSPASTDLNNDNIEESISMMDLYSWSISNEDYDTLTQTTIEFFKDKYCRVFITKNNANIKTFTCPGDINKATKNQHLSTFTIPVFEEDYQIEILTADFKNE